MNWQTNFTDRELTLIENCRLAVSEGLTTTKGLKYDWNIRLMSLVDTLVTRVEQDSPVYLYGAAGAIVAFAEVYSRSNPAGLPGHNLLIIIAKLNKVLAAATGEQDEA